MKTLIAFLLAATCAFANVAYKTANYTSASTSASSVAASITAASGDFVVAFVAVEGSCVPANTYVEFSDGAGTLTVDKSINAATSYGAWLASGFLTGNATVTASFYTDSGKGTAKTCTYRRLVLATFTGVKSTSPLNGTPAAASATSTSISSGAVTNTTAGSVQVCGYAVENSGRTLTDATFSIPLQNGSAGVVAIGYRLNAASGTNCTATISGANTTWMAAGAAYAPESYSAATSGVRHRVTQ